MKRVLTQDIANHGAGQIIDWPMPTWNQVADGSGMGLDEFSEPYVEPGSVELGTPVKKRGTSK